MSPRRRLRGHFARALALDRSEKIEQAETVRLLAALGAEVYVLGTRRPRGRECPSCGTFVAAHQGTCQTPGIADLVVFLPGPRPRSVLFIEQKKIGGALSEAQRQFAALVEGSVACHVAGTLDDVLAWLKQRSYVR